MRRRNVFLIGLALVILLVAGGGYLFWQQGNAQRASAATAARQTGTLTRGDLAATVSGAGNITAPQQSNLSFAVSGVPVTQVNVKVGATVKKGDVLAEADATQLNEQLTSAQSNLATAQAKLDDLKAPPTTQELAIAEAQLQGAQASYDAAVAKLNATKAPATATELQAARATLASAQAAYDTAAAKANMTGEQITVQRATLEKARITLQAAQAAYNAIAWQDNAPASSAAKDLQTATIDYEAAQANYNLAQTEMTNGALKSAEASLANARKTLDDLVKGATADTLASAQSSVDSASSSLMQAKKSLDDLKAGATQADLLAAQASVDDASSAVAQAKRAMDDAKIIAPFDGVVADVKTFVGQTATSGTTAITLVNTKDLEILVQLSEVDVAQVKPGQEVQLTFDALSGASYPGKVVAVSPLGTSSQGVVNYNVNVALPNPDPAILPGMTAQASIIIAKRSNALIAPSRSVRNQGNRRLLTLLFEGREVPLLVQTGLTNETGTEILGATTTDGQAVQLQEGDTVLLTTTTTTGTGQRNGAFGGGFGGPGQFVVPVGR